MTKRAEDLKNILSHYETHDRPFNPKLFSSLLDEFLHSFILIGYTPKGEPIAITSAKSTQEIDALHTSLQRFIAMFIVGGDLGSDEEEAPQDE